MLKRYVTTLTLIFTLSGTLAFAQTPDSRTGPREETRTEIVAAQRKLLQFKLHLLQLNLIQKREGLGEIALKPLVMKHYHDLIAGTKPADLESDELLDIRSSRSVIREINLVIKLYKLDLLTREDFFEEVDYLYDIHLQATYQCDTYLGQFFYDLAIFGRDGLYNFAQDDSRRRHEMAAGLFARTKGNGSERGNAATRKLLENGSERGNRSLPDPKNK